MKMLFVADLHYALKQFNWLVTSAPAFDTMVICSISGRNATWHLTEDLPAHNLYSPPRKCEFPA